MNITLSEAIARGLEEHAAWLEANPPAHSAEQVLQMTGEGGPTTCGRWVWDHERDECGFCRQHGYAPKQDGRYTGYLPAPEDCYVWQQGHPQGGAVSCGACRLVRRRAARAASQG